MSRTLLQQVQLVPTLPAKVDVSPGATASFAQAGSSWHTIAPSTYAATGNHILFSIASYQLAEEFTPLPGEPSSCRLLCRSP